MVSFREQVMLEPFNPDWPHLWVVFRCAHKQSCPYHSWGGGGGGGEGRRKGKKYSI